MLEAEIASILQRHFYKNKAVKSKGLTQWTKCLALLKPVIAALTWELDRMAPEPDRTHHAHGTPPPRATSRDNNVGGKTRPV
jgi:hypothetical protein